MSGSLQVKLVSLAFLISPLAHTQTVFPDAIRQQDVMVAARDGVELATDIYRPGAQGVPTTQELPVLLHRTPYNKNAADAVKIAEYLCRHGYVVMLQDIRGRHSSEGVFSKYYAYDSTDGFDTIAWAAKQPYSNGSVAMYGTSYAAHTQADASKLNPPALKTAILNMGGMSSAWDHSVRFDGAFEMGRQLTWAWGQILEDAKDPTLRELFTKEKVTDWYSALPLRKGLSPLAAAPNYEGYYLDEATKSDFDDHWNSIGMNWENFYRQTSDIPMLHIGGWYDIYLRGTIENFHKLTELKKQPERLIIGPWTHHGNIRCYAGDVDFGADACIKDFDTDFHLRWFDHYLKGIDTAAATEAPVRYFVMGTGDGHKDSAGRLVHGGYWRNSQSWPPPQAKPITYYLHGDGTLSAKPPENSEEQSTEYTFDPEHPVPTIGGGVSARLKDGAFNQRERPDFYGSRAPWMPLRARNDVVVFETEPLAEDMQISGPVTVQLFAATTAVDTDFTAKLLDVYPPSASFPQGFDLNLTDAILRASYRGGTKVRKLLTPGTVYPLTIRPFDTANVFKKGHRIRIDISSSNFPRFDVNPNTGEPLGQNRREIKADQTIYHSQRYPSHVVLYLMPERHS